MDKQTAVQLHNETLFSTKGEDLPSTQDMKDSSAHIAMSEKSVRKA